MSHRLSRAKSLTGAIVREVRSENVTLLAGSIAYHAFVSLLPFLLLMLLVVSRVGGEDVARTLVRGMAGALAPGAGDSTAAFADILVNAALNATRSAGLSIVTAAALVWGTLRIFRGLDKAFSDIYESESANTFVDQVTDGAAVFVAIGLAIALLSAGEVLLGVPSFGVANVVVRPAVSALAIAIALYPMYYVFPDEDVTVLEVVPGALVAGTSWTALSMVFRFYVAQSTAAEYGVVGVVVLFITWLYFGGLALLLGAVVNAVLAGRSEDVANVAWGHAESDPTADDARFVAPLESLDDVDWEDDLRVITGDTDVTLPPPDGVTVIVDTVDRPALLGGSRETGRLVLKWESNP